MAPCTVRASVCSKIMDISLSKFRLATSFKEHNLLSPSQCTPSIGALVSLPECGNTVSAPKESSCASFALQLIVLRSKWRIESWQISAKNGCQKTGFLRVQLVLKILHKPCFFDAYSFLSTSEVYFRNLYVGLTTNCYRARKLQRLAEFCQNSRKEVVQLK